jgi:hypothetical protein
MDLIDLSKEDLVNIIRLMTKEKEYKAIDNSVMLANNMYKPDIHIKTGEPIFNKTDNYKDWIKKMDELKNKGLIPKLEDFGINPSSIGKKNGLVLYIRTTTSLWTNSQGHQVIADTDNINKPIIDYLTKYIWLINDNTIVKIITDNTQRCKYKNQEKYEIFVEMIGIKFDININNSYEKCI